MQQHLYLHIAYLPINNAPFHEDRRFPISEKRPIVEDRYSTITLVSSRRTVLF